MKFRLLFVAVCLLLAGCASTGTRAISLESDGEDRVRPNDIVNIAINEHIAMRAEPISDAMGITSHRRLIKTGPIWRRVFIGADDAPAELEIVSTKFDESFGAAGFIMRYTYSVEANLLIGDKTYPISARGTRAAGMMFQSARRQAVELAVINTAHQAEGILAALKK